MEWVETTARTVEEALDLALDKLGVDEDEAEYEVLEEPKAGLFGRVRGQARLRARVAPKTPRAKTERRDRRRKKKSDEAPVAENEATEKGERAEKAEKSGMVAAEKPAPKREPRSERSSRPDVSDLPELENDEVAAQVTQFVEGLVAAFGYDSAVSAEIHSDELEVKVDGKHGLLVGPKGRTLDAIQELARTVVQRAGNTDLRIRADVGGYRQLRREALEDYAAAALELFQKQGGELRLEAMPPADRKVVHDALSGTPGLVTRSDGREPHRRIVLSATPE